MRVHVEDDLYITSDERQFMLAKRVTYTNKKTNEQEEQYNAIGYYTDLASLLRGLVKRKLLQSTAETLQDLIKSVESVKAEIERLVKA